MKGNSTGWHVCDFCGYTMQTEHFIILGVLDICDRHGENGKQMAETLKANVIKLIAEEREIMNKQREQK